MRDIQYQMVLFYTAQTEIMTHRCEATEEDMRQLNKTPRRMLSSKRLDDLGLPTYPPTPGLSNAFSKRAEVQQEKEREAGCGVVRASGN